MTPSPRNVCDRREAASSGEPPGLPTFTNRGDMLRMSVYESSEGYRVCLQPRDPAGDRVTMRCVSGPYLSWRLLVEQTKRFHTYRLRTRLKAAGVCQDLRSCQDSVLMAASRR